MSKNKFFRNREAIASVDAEALWKQKKDGWVLVDKDVHVFVSKAGNEDVFYEVEIPAEAEKRL